MTASDGTTATDGPQPRVEHAAQRSRYEISADGEQAGFTAYTDLDGRRVFYHTVIEERFGGRGLASMLVTSALTDTRAAGTRIVPVCPYVAKYLRSHHDFDDIVDPVTDEALAAARAAASGPVRKSHGSRG